MLYIKGANFTDIGLNGCDGYFTESVGFGCDKSGSVVLFVCSTTNEPLLSEKLYALSNCFLISKMSCASIASLSVTL